MNYRLINLSIMVLLLTQSSDLSAAITKRLATRRVTIVEPCKVGYGSFTQEKANASECMARLGSVAFYPPRC